MREHYLNDDPNTMRFNLLVLKELQHHAPVLNILPTSPIPPDPASIKKNAKKLEKTLAQILT